MKNSKLKVVIVVAVCLLVGSLVGCSGGSKDVEAMKQMLSGEAPAGSGQEEVEPFGDAKDLVVEAFGEGDQYLDFRVEKTKEFIELANRMTPAMERLMCCGMARPGVFEQTGIDYERGEDAWSLAQYGEFEEEGEPATYTDLSLNFYLDPYTGEEVCDYALRLTVPCTGVQSGKLSEDQIALIKEFDENIDIAMLKIELETAYNGGGTYDQYTTLAGSEEYSLRIYRTIYSFESIDLNELDISIVKGETCK